MEKFDNIIWAKEAQYSIAQMYDSIYIKFNSNKN